MSIGYKWNYSEVLGFSANEGGGIIEPSDPYLSSLFEIFLFFLFAMLLFLTF